MKTIAACLILALWAGCAHQPELRQVESASPIMTVADGVEALVEKHARLGDFARYSEDGPAPEPLTSFEALERRTARFPYTVQERSEQRRWFKLAAGVWYCTFAEQFSAVLFTDAFGQVQYAMLLG